MLGEVPLGKPTDAADAGRMLRLLSGRMHHVVTGYVAACCGARASGAVTTEVRLRHLTDVEIALYVAGGEPLDKAGSYAIQGGGGALVDTVTGSYTNVVGLPLAEVLASLALLGGR